MSSERCAILTAGAAATLAMIGASRLARSPVMPDLQELAATAAAPPGSFLGQAAGFTAQLMNGALFAECYRALFQASAITPSWRTGAALGLAHGALAGVLLAAVPPLHPRVPEQVPAPGAFMRYSGIRAAAMLVALHGLYGAVVGASVRSVVADSVAGRDLS